jgi:hypothetical protein
MMRAFSTDWIRLAAENIEGHTGVLKPPERKQSEA